MPGKTSRSRRKQSPIGRRKSSRVAPAARETSGAPEAPPAATVPSRAAPAATSEQYSYIYSELRRISILAAIILAILIVLSLVLQ